MVRKGHSFMQADIVKIRKKLKNSLDPYRFEHTLSVSYIGIALAMKYGCNLEQAEISGLLHDCAKRYDENTIIQKCLKYNLSVTEFEMKVPDILHAKLGAFMAMHKFHINDDEIINAILVHTTGRPAMTLLEKILFTADYIEPRRDKAPNLEELRKIAFEDLDQAVYMILENTISYLQAAEKTHDMMTIKAYEYYRDKLEGGIK